MKYNSILAILLYIILCSCESKQSAVYDLLVFRTEVKENCKNYTQSDWEDAIDKYEEICQRLDEMQLSKEERLEVNKIKGEIAGYAATVVVQDVSDECQKIIEEAKSFNEGFSKTFQLPQNE